MDARTAAGVASRWARIWWPASTPLVGEQPGNRSNNSSVTTVLLTMLPWVAGVQRWQRGALGVGTVGCPLRSVTVRPCAWSQCGYRLAEAAHVNRFALEQNQASGSRLPESDREDMEGFLARIRQLLPVLGSDILAPIAHPAANAPPGGVLFCRNKGAEARGQRTANGFVVFHGSTAVLEERPS